MTRNVKVAETRPRVGRVSVKPLKNLEIMTKVKSTVNAELRLQLDVFFNASQLLNAVEQFLIENQKYLESADVVLKAYNNGYEIQTNIKLNLGIFCKDLSHNENTFIGFLYNFSGIYFHPETFFESNLKDGKARLEYAVPTHDKQDSLFGKKHLRREVENMEQARAVSTYWKNQVIKAMKAANELV